MQRPILITGSHKSGKSFVAKGISFSNKVSIINEPLNLSTRIGITGLNIDYWYYYIDGKNDLYGKEFLKTLKYDYRLWKQIRKIKSLIDFIQIIKDVYYTQLKKIRSKNKRPLIDDPFAVLSSAWFYQTFNMSMIIMIRHPASFISSLKVNGWQHPFSHFQEQENLMTEMLYPFQQEIVDFARKPRNIVDQGILLWRIIYYNVFQFKQKYNRQWYFVRFEDFARNPIQEFENVYKYLDLDFDQTVKEKIEAYLNKKEGISGRSTINITDNAKKYSIYEQCKYFKGILSASEIAQIKEKTKDVWPWFYNESDWD